MLVYFLHGCLLEIICDKVLERDFTSLSSKNLFSLDYIVSISLENSKHHLLHDFHFDEGPNQIVKYTMYNFEDPMHRRLIDGRYPDPEKRPGIFCRVPIGKFEHYSIPQEDFKKARSAKLLH